MVESAEFKVSLQDDMTKNALKAQASIKSLEGQLRSLNKAAAAARGPDALRKFGISDDLKAARGRANVIRQNAAAQAAAQAKAGRAATVEAKRQADFKQFKADNGLGSQIAGAMPIGGTAAVAAGLALVAAAGLAAAAAVAHLGIEFSKATIEAAVFQQRSIQALDLLIGSAGTAVVQFHDLRREAQGLGLDVHETQKSFQKLLAAQFEIGKARELIRMGSDLQAIGATGEEVGRVLLALTQIKAKGRLQAQEMLQLQEAGVSAELVYKALEGRLGKTKDELKKLQEQGKIGGTDAIEAIIEAVRHKTGADSTGDAGKKFAENTLAGMKGKFMAGIQNLFIDAGGAIEATLVPLAQKVVDLFETIINDPDVKAFGTHLLREFQYFEAWVSQNWPEIKSTIVGGLEDIMTVVRLSVDTIDVMIGYWEEWKMVGLGLAVVLGVMALGVFIFLLPLYLLIGVIVLVLGLIGYAIGWLYENFTNIPSIIGEAFKAAALAAYQWGVDMVQGLINGIKSMLGMASQAGAEMADAAGTGFTVEAAIHSPSKLFEEYGIYTVQGYVQGVEASNDTIVGATADMAGAAVRGIESDDTSSAGSVSSTGNNYQIELNVYASDTAGGRQAGIAARGELLKLFEELDGVSTTEFSDTGTE